VRLTPRPADAPAVHAFHRESGAGHVDIVAGVRDRPSSCRISPASRTRCAQAVSAYDLTCRLGYDLTCRSAATIRGLANKLVRLTAAVATGRQDEPNRRDLAALSWAQTAPMDDPLSHS
jgi:hypothetical protein